MEDRDVRNWYFEQRGRTLVKKLEKRGFKAYFAATIDEARKKVISLIPEGASVGLTGSQTQEQIGVKSFLRESDRYNVIDPYEPGIDFNENVARRKKTLTSNVMISSTNAITEDGALVNVDGMGNRVAGLIFGPDKVILAIGMKKVVKDIHEAFQRLKSVAGPMNNKRLELSNPCTETGFCMDCANSTRICNYYTIMERSFIPDRIHIVLIGQDLGY